ncbi:MAG TPA: ATP-binding protein [Phycisphaerae bacterium]|nr:ATP-binding protein [Phycisphaerae bacterium]
MTAAKRLGLANLAVITLGACAAHYAVMLVIHKPDAPDARLGYVIPGLLAGLTVMILFLFQRKVHRAAGRIASQLRRMTGIEQIEPVVVDRHDELADMGCSLNDFLTRVRDEREQLRAENRELQIQARIAAAEKHHTEAIIFSISDAVIVTNRFDELLLANEAAEKLLGFRLATSVRKNIDRIISDGMLVRLVRETRSHGANFTRKVVEHTIDQKGLPRTFTITLSCVVGVADEVSGVVAVLHDVTREKEIARMKTDFVSNVSHELKTPLASIKAYVEMLIDGEAESEATRNEFYEIISTETDRLHRLIENILNISRIESGVVKVVREPMSLPGLVKQVMDVAAPQARLKNIRLEGQIPPVYCQVEADRDMIYQAVMNLVSNAIKYTPPGGAVTVSLGVDERQGVTFCEVTDTGAGIPPEELPHIFDKFYRVRANNKLAKGTGLGLCLVKHIVETVHSGKLSVTSEEGKGSTFSFELSILQ